MNHAAISRTSLVALVAAVACVACTVEPGSDEPLGSASSAVVGSGALSGSTTMTGYYTYPARTMTFAASAGCVFAGGTVNVQALDVPNRFTVRDQNGNFVAGSQWLGNATYPGPWGGSLSTSNPSTASLSIPQAGTYTLVVETSPQPYGMSDAWEASYNSRSTSCSTSSGGTSSGGTSSGGTSSGGCVDSLQASAMSGTYPAGRGYYTYPDRTFTVSFCTPRTLHVRAYALDVPNRVNVYAPSGNLVASSGWIGYTSQPGPWGSSLTNSGSATLSFTSTNGTYRVRVETVTSDRSDAWQASVY